MQTHTADKHWTPITVISWVRKVLAMRGRERAAPDVHRVVGLDDRLSAVPKVPVSQQEARAAETQVGLMKGRHAIRHDGDADAVVGAAPRVTLHVSADSE